MPGKQGSNGAPATALLGWRNADCQPRAVERVGEIHQRLALGGHGQRTDHHIQLILLQSGQQLIERHGLQLVAISGLLGDGLPQIDADAAPAAIGLLNDEGRHLCDAHTQHLAL